MDADEKRTIDCAHCVGPRDACLCLRERLARVLSDVQEDEACETGRPYDFDPYGLADAVLDALGLEQVGCHDHDGVHSTAWHNTCTRSDFGHDTCSPIYRLAASRTTGG